MELLALVFRPLSAGKFEELLTLFGGAAGTTPLLLPTLSMLRAILKGPRVGAHKDLLLELCLTMPARCGCLLHSNLGQVCVYMHALLCELACACVHVNFCTSIEV